MRNIIFFIGIMALAATILYAYSSGPGGYTVMPSASVSLPSANNQVENRVKKSVPATMALKDLRFAGPVAVLEG